MYKITSQFADNSEKFVDVFDAQAAIALMKVWVTALDLENMSPTSCENRGVFFSIEEVADVSD